jgi:hypothetical protein
MTVFERAIENAKNTLNNMKQIRQARKFLICSGGLAKHFDPGNYRITEQ